VFDDMKSFKNFLGTLDLGFKGKLDDLTDLKSWINKFFVIEIEEIYNGVQFKIKDDEILFITKEGAISKNGICKNIKSDERNDIRVMDLEGLTKEELREIKKHIFRFATPDKSISIIGTIINNMAVSQCRAVKNKLHHLLIVGEAGSGKSTILENVIAPILNYPLKEIKSLGLATNFSLIKDLSDGNYSMIYEEHKPSFWDRYKVLKISEVLRNLYDGSTVARGDKSLKSKNFYLGRPVIIAGEESYYNNEKALIERSCIIYVSKKERTEKSSDAIEWIMKNEKLLNRLGKELMDVILNLSVEEYMKIRDRIKTSITDLKDRTLNTALNIAMGMEILNMLFKSKGIKQIPDYIPHLIQNIKNEVLEEGGESHSVVEQMLVLYNDMIEDGRAYSSDDVVRYRGDGIFIKTSEMINQIHEHVNKVGADITPLKLKDFKKQAMKSGYLQSCSSKVIKVGTKTVRFDTYDKEFLRELKVNSIVPPESEEITDEGDKVIPFSK
jgi:ABC-type dipeptide/oligopeptide/nickel transport system ATPase component